MANRLKRSLTILLAVAGIAATASTAHADWRSDPDAVSCGYSRHENVSPVSAELAGAWLETVASTVWQLPTTPTFARDPLRIDLHTSKNYVGHVGGGGGLRMAYDPLHHVLATCNVEDTAEVLTLLSHIPEPPFSVPHRDLAALSTRHGIGLGSTLAAVRRVYGPAPIVTFAKGHSGVAYERSDAIGGSPRGMPTNSPFGVYTWFEIANGRVVALQRETGF